MTCPVSWLKPTPRSKVAEPSQHWTAAYSLIKHEPEPDMMSSVCAPAIGLLESELFFFSFIIERADRGIVIRPVKQYATDDFDA